MILIGQYDSSYVRRVAIALKVYEIPFEHRPWSTFGDLEKIRRYNPLIRVPTLIIGNGDVLIETHVIIDYIDGLVPVDMRLYPQSEPNRHRAMKTAALAGGMADKAVALFYEKAMHKSVSQAWVDRCRAQVSGALAELDADRATRASPYWYGETIGHADIAVAASIRHAIDSDPNLIDLDAYPALKVHVEKLEALPLFQEISQPFIAPA